MATYGQPGARPALTRNQYAIVEEDNLLSNPAYPNYQRPKWNHLYCCYGHFHAVLFTKYCLFMCHPQYGGDFRCGTCRMHPVLYYLFFIFTVPFALVFAALGLIFDIFAVVFWTLTGGCFGACCPPGVSTDIESVMPKDDTRCCRNFGRRVTYNWFLWNSTGLGIHGAGLVGIFLSLFLPSCYFLMPDDLDESQFVPPQPGVVSHV